MKKWLVRNTDNALAMKLKTDTGLPMLLCSLLVGRGIYTAEQAQQYFNGIVFCLTSSERRWLIFTSSP